MTTNYISTTITVGINPTGMVMRGDILYVTNVGEYKMFKKDAVSGTVSAINMTTNSVFNTIPVGKYPSRMITNGDTLYVTNSGGSTISLIDITEFNHKESNIVINSKVTAASTNTVNLEVSWESLPKERSIVSLNMGNIFRKVVFGNQCTFENVSPKTRYVASVFVNEGSGVMRGVTEEMSVSE